MTGSSDEELLGALARCLAEPSPPPSPAAVSALRSAFLAATTSRRDSRRLRLLKPVPLLAAGVLAVGTSTAAAAASGAVLPGPLRSVAVAVGLPVDDSAVAAARTSIDDLDQQIKTGDDEHLATAVASVRSRLDRLSSSDRVEVQPLGGGVLHRAEIALARDESADGADTGSGAAGPGSAGVGSGGGTSTGSGGGRDGASDEGREGGGAAGSTPAAGGSGTPDRDGSRGSVGGSTGSGGGTGTGTTGGGGDTDGGASSSGG